MKKILFQSWYQDEFGVLLCQEETEEEFYSDDELNQHEAALRKEQSEPSPKPAKAVEQNKSVIDIERSKSSEKPNTKPETPPVPTNLPAKPVEEAAPAQESQKPSKPEVTVTESQAVKPAVKEPRSLTCGTKPRERWLWAYTKILQVGETSRSICQRSGALSLVQIHPVTVL